LAQIQREIDDLRHETAEYTRLDPEPDPFTILAPDDLPDHPNSAKGGHDAAEWELVNNAWDSPDLDPDLLEGLDDGLDEIEHGLETPNDDLTASNPYSQPKSEILNPQFEIPPPPLDPFDYQPKSKFIY
jgi:hypothetical protein